MSFPKLKTGQSGGLGKLTGTDEETVGVLLLMMLRRLLLADGVEAKRMLPD